MSAKVIVIFCAQALFVQFALSQCAGRANLGAGLTFCGLSSPIVPGLPAPVLPASACSAPGLSNYGIGIGNIGLGYDSGLGYGSNLAIKVIPTSGGSLPIFSISSLSPTGLSVVSENVLDGNLYVTGELPFASAVALEGVLPSGGAGAISYSCGDGVTAIESIAPSAAAIVPGAYGAGLGAYGAGLEAYGAGLGAYGSAAAIAPLSLAPGVGCNAINAPIAGIVAPIDGCYPSGIYY